MPLYYFDIHNDEYTRDDEGLTFADEDGARAEAIKSARALICEEVGKGRVTLSHAIAVLDDQRRPCFVVRFSDAVTIL